VETNGDYEAIVIGAGLGGLACAALLASDGRRVLVLERNDYLGGRCSAYQRDGFTVDRGTHMITRIEGGPYEKLVKRLGLEGELKFICLEHDDPPLPVRSVDGSPRAGARPRVLEVQCPRDGRFGAGDGARDIGPRHGEMAR
jgi:phytoene dehydrogenase-like protein